MTAQSNPYRKLNPVKAPCKITYSAAMLMLGLSEDDEADEEEEDQEEEDEEEEDEEEGEEEEEEGRRR